MPDGTNQMAFPTVTDAEAPHLDVNRDAGHFVSAFAQLPPGTTIMAAGTCANGRNGPRRRPESSALKTSRASGSPSKTLTERSGPALAGRLARWFSTRLGRDMEGRTLGVLRLANLKKGKS